MADPASSAASPEAPSTSSALSARWAVHKFGGTSLSTADCYRSAVDTVLHTAGVIDAKRNSTPRVPVFYPGATSATDSPLVSSATSTSLSLPELTLTPAASPSPSTSSPPSPEPPALRRTSSVGMYGAEWSAFEGVRQAVVVSAMGDVKPQPHLEEQAPELVGGLQKVTSLILEATRLASERKPEYAAVVEELRVRHERTVEELLGNAESKDAVLRLLRTELQDLQHILKAVWLNKRLPPESEAWWSGLGELWSARMMCAYFNHVSSPERVAVCMDARDVMVVKWSELGANPDIEATRVRLRAWLSQPHVQAARVVVVTGYIGRTIDGVPTTLGRDGSDVTASFLAALLQAESLTIWKDVDGVYSAHPGVVPDAILRTDISYHEAMELSYFGSKILHPKTMTPLVRNNVPVFIRNSFNTGVPGTSIHTVRSGRKTYFGVQGFSAKRDLAVVTLEATGLIGVLGIAHRAIKALAAVRCSVHMITQADSQHSICFAVLDSNADAVLASIQREFRVELEEGQVQTVQLTRGVACIAVVGDGMVHKIGVAGRVFGALAQKQINIIAIAQGSSERNISVLIDRNEADDALRAIHAAFVPVPHRMRIVLVVGSSELPFPHPPSDSGAPDSPRRSHGEMVSDLVERLIACGGTVRSSPVSVRVVGLVDVCRGQQLLQTSERRGLGVEHIKQFYASGAAGVQDRRVQVSPVNWEAVEQHLLPSSKVPSENQPRIIIDVTRTTPPLERYRHWASRGIHVISSNPFVHCIPLQQYTDLLHKNHLLHTTQTLSDSPPGEALTRARPSETLYHSFHNCPVSLLHNSLSSMLEALTLRGDTISRVECVVASPLSVLFNAYNPTRADRTLAAILKPSDASPAATWQKRVRSSNLMAACALVGTARVLGIPAEVEHVRVADFGATDASCSKWCASLFSTVEKEFNACENGVAADDKDDARLEELFAKLYAAAHENNKVLRFAATLDSERNMVVGVREFPRSHPFARMRSDTRHSCALIYTAQFGSANPIVLDIPASRNECSSAAAHTLVVAEIEALKNALVPAEGSNDKP